MSIASRVGRAAAKAIVVRAASTMKEGTLAVRLPDGKLRAFGRGEPRASLHVLNDAFFSRIVAGGEIGFGEAYMDDLWRADDLVALLELGIRNRRNIGLDMAWLGRLSRLRDRRWHLGRRNTAAGARRNIGAHYDLSNDLFRLFLDETMTYSCAYFTSPDETLKDAQRNKYRRLCERVDLRPSDHVLEIGCGWGGFAIFAAGTYGCGVTTITISREQRELARERVAAAGLSDLVDVRFCDYRDVTGMFDKIVSIEMFEAVGAEYFETFFRVCDRALRPGGLMALQTITVPDRSFATLRDGVNWMQKYIFPGGMLPSIGEIERALRPTQLVIGGAEDIGPHYALTLRRWRERFLANADAVRALGFDDRFLRMWEYYLAASEAGFLTRNTGDLQITFEKPAGRAVPRFARAEQRAGILV
ncbi:MAG: cyclopropane-fatty-acyl-phospholipid synthase family protein [Dehalococcoidia bacterium]